MRAAIVLLVGLPVFSMPPVLTFAAEPTGIPKQALEEMEYRVGKWESTLSSDGEEQESKGHEVTQWAPGKKYGIRIRSSFWQDGIKVHASGLVGWDPEKKQLVEHWYLSDGSYATFCYFLDKKKDAWVGTFKWVHADGEVLAGESIVEKKDRDEWVCNASSLDQGKKLTWKTINRRVK